MKNLKEWALIAITIVLTMLAMKTYQHFKQDGTIERTTVVDTCIVYDTVKYFQPVPKDSVVVRYVTATLPTVQHIDTVTVFDSIQVKIPITQKEYKDSSYHAFVSGYMPSLDSITVYPRTIYINSTTTNKYVPKTKRWGLGVQAGYGAYLNNGVVHATPYIGIGISYNIFSW